MSDPDGISTWKAEMLDGKSKIRYFPDLNYSKKMEGNVTSGYTTLNTNQEKKNKKLLSMQTGLGFGQNIGDSA
jgi:hypothetical protein